MSKEVKNQAVSFDVWKTLIVRNPSHKSMRNNFIANRFGTDVVETGEALHKVDELCDETSDEFGFQFGPNERLQFLSDALGVKLGQKAIAELAEGVQDLFLGHLPEHQEPNLIETLDSIAAERDIVLTSNTGLINGEYMRQALRSIGILDKTNLQVFSNEVGAAKPHPKIFGHMAALLGREFHEITHVGDNLIADYYGANAVGMKAVHITSEPVQTDIVTAKTIAEAHEKGLL